MLSLIKPQRNFLSLILNTVTVIGCSKMGSSTTGKYKNHKTLADFGYAFNEQGELRDVKSAKPFTFVVRIIYSFYFKTGSLQTDYSVCQTILKISLSHISASLLIEQIYLTLL